MQIIEEEYNNQISIYHGILNNTSEAVIITDEENKIIEINKACENITGYTSSEVKGLNPKVFASHKTEEDVFKKIWEQIHETNYWIGELFNRHKSGNIYPVIIKIFKLQNPKTNKTNYYAIFSDISFQKESNSELLHLAYHDSLTNLPNRLKLKAQLEYVISNSKRNDLKFAVLYLDLDHFKKVNDILGHIYGDEVLVSLSDKFKNIVRTNDMVARVGGDEFIIVLSDISNYLFIERVCNKILSIVNKPIVLDKTQIDIGVSIGISIYPDNAQDIDTLINHSDTAMYHAKNHGKNSFEFYSDWMNKKMLEYNEVEKRLKTAIETDEFIVHFQPEIDLSTNKVFSLEVLSRWDSKDRGILMPNAFLSDLDYTKLIFDFEKLILKKACKQLKKWQDEKLYTGTISVNISGKHLEYGNLYESVINALSLSRLDAKYLELEFHESDVMKVSSKTLVVLSKLSHLGVGLSIDNFGKGFSSFNYLRECSISKLKIDKSYIDSLIEEKNDEDIIKSIVDLGLNMGISVIAEGIEMPQQDEIIKKSACTKVQGYFYARPMSIKHFESWHKNFRLLNTLS